MTDRSAGLPTGTVTFLFSDIEGSTQLWERYPLEMRSALAKHDAIVREGIAANHGHIIKTTGDGVHAVFGKAIEAVGAALDIQRSLSAAEFFEAAEAVLCVRMGLHTGEAELRGGDYFGQALNRAARVMSIAHGGQVLLSGITAEVVREHLSPGTRLLDLGEYSLKDLLRPEHLYQLSAADLPSEFPALPSSRPIPGNLPAPLTSFIGRDKEMADVRALIRSGRLVTLTGSGGTGKSRLSVEIGRGELGNQPHGVWLVELAPLSDPNQIIPTLAQVFGLQDHPFGSLATMLVDYLRDKRLLLILDNCEHLVEACARLVDELLRQCSGLRILASSREALGVGGEVAYHTPSLADSESVRLFGERAKAVNPNFHQTEGNVAAIAQICARLDGIPLAIELAAARARLLSPEQIALRLDDRFRLLVGGSRTALPRQQTLRALIDWSYDLLTEEEKGLFRLTSVFVGGWTLEALEAVADDPYTLEHLEQLVNKSLVITEERGTEMRYLMLETIRQYAREKLFEARQSSAGRDRHFAYFDHLAEYVWNVFQTDNILSWRDQGDDEIENMRAAVEWGLENYPERAIRLASNFCLATGWMGSRMEDGLTLCRSAIQRVRSLPPADGPANSERQNRLARAFFAQGMVGMSHGNIPVVLRDLQDGIEAARQGGDKHILGYCLEMFYIASQFINTPGDEEAAREGFRIFTEEVDDNWGRAMAYLSMARIAANRGDAPEQEKYFAQFRDHIQQVPLSLPAGLFYLGAGMSERIHGNHQAAKSYFEEGIAVFKKIRNSNFELIMRSELGHVARQMGDIVQAKNIYRETLERWQDLGNRAAIANQLECFGFIAILDEDPQRAARLLGAAESLRRELQAPMTDFEQIEYDELAARLHSMLPVEELRALRAEGQGLTMKEAVQIALGV